MRIAYLTGEYPRATDTFIQREVFALRNLGVEVDTFSVRMTGEEHIVGAEQKSEREKTFYILPPNLVNLLLAHLSLLSKSPQNYFKAIRLAWSTRQTDIKGAIYQLFYFAEAGILAQEIQRRNIHHLHNHIATSSCTVAMLAAELGGFTYSFTLHGPHIFFEPYRWRLDEKIKQALFVCCISHFCRSQGMYFVPMEYWSKMYIVHCGIESELFEIVQHQPNQKRLLYVGRLAAEKGLPILLESLSKIKVQHPEVILTIVGDGSDRNSIEQLTTQLNLTSHVKFVGYQSQTEVRQHLQNTDLFVLPSFAEGVPVSLMEAMAAGIPVIATRIAGVSELVEDGVSGYLIPPGDTITLAQKIDHLLSDHLLREQFGKEGRKKVEQEFNLSSEVSKLYQILLTTT